MNKVILSTFAAALVCVVASSAMADHGISSKTLADMGLSSLKVMSDSDALAIRGMGYRGSRDTWKRRDKGHDSKKATKRTEPSSKAYGNSWATVEYEAEDGYEVEGDAHSENGYMAEGPYAAAGENFSDATVVKTDQEIVEVNGVLNSVTKVWSLHVEAGGFSSASSF